MSLGVMALPGDVGYSGKYEGTLPTLPGSAEEFEHGLPPSLIYVLVTSSYLLWGRFLSVLFFPKSTWSSQFSADTEQENF